MKEHPQPVNPTFPTSSSTVHRSAQPPLQCHPNEIAAMSIAIAATSIAIEAMSIAIEAMSISIEAMSNSIEAMSNSSVKLNIPI